MEKCLVFTTVHSSHVNRTDRLKYFDSAIIYEFSGCIELYGDPLREVEVRLKQQGGPSLTTMTDSNGCYKFKDAVVGEKIKLEFDNSN